MAFLNTEAERKQITSKANDESLINFCIISGWLYKLKVKNSNELKELMNETAYEAFKKMEEQEAAV